VRTLSKEGGVEKVSLPSVFATFLAMWQSTFQNQNPLKKTSYDFRSGVFATFFTTPQPTSCPQI
jgi:hypothetical protein